MPRYLETAAKAQAYARKLLDMIPADKHPEASALIDYLVNIGVRCSPRGVQSTVRLNAVREAVKELPVTVRMALVKDPVTGKEFNALTVMAKDGVISSEEPDSGSDGV